MSALATKHRTDYTPQMITGAQIRAARALLGWTTQRLADESGVHYATLSRAEQTDTVPSVRAPTLATVQTTLEKAGIIFVPSGSYTGTGGQGVRLDTPV